jgi:hypothetical protein
VIRPPDPRLVSFSLSGFIVGVIVTLLATGTFFRASKDNTAAPPTPATSLPTPPGTVQPSAMEVRIRAIVLRQLGPGISGQKTGRLVSLQLQPVELVPSRFLPTRLDPRYRSVVVVFRLLDHPLGKVWRLRGAKADVFGLMKALYTSGLAIYNVDLLGQFPLPQGKVVRDTRAIDAYMSHDQAEHIPWKRWDRTHEGQCWSLLSYKYVAPGFA